MSFIFLLYMMRYGIFPYDDGVLLYGAERILAGNIPYRDFYLVYTPGNLYLLALVFKIFGPSIMIERILNTIVSLFILITTYLITRKLTKNFYALIFAIFLTTFCIWLDSSYANQNIPLLFSLLSGLCFINYMIKEEKRYLIFSGLLIGVTALFRHDFGLYTFIAVTITLLAFEYHKNSDTCSDLFTKIKDAVKNWLVLLGSILIITIPPMIYFLMMVPVHDLYTAFIVFPTKIYTIYVQHSFPMPTNIFYLITIYFPIFILIITLLWLLFKIKYRGINQKEWIIIFLLLLGLVFLNSFRLLPYYPHMYLTMITSIILLSFLLSEYVRIDRIISRFKHAEKHDQNRNIIFTSFIILIIVVVCLFSIHIFYQTVNDNPLPLDTAKGSGIFIHSSLNDLKETVNYVQENIPPSEKIFIASYSQDKIIGNTPIFYFLTDRNSATKYSEIIDGVVNTPTVQNEIIDELKKNNVKFVILYESPQDESIGAMDLVQYIKSYYKPVKTIGYYIVYKLVE